MKHCSPLQSFPRPNFREERVHQEDERGNKSSVLGLGREQIVQNDMLNYV